MLNVERITIDETKLDKDFPDKLNMKGLQSVRHLMHAIPFEGMWKQIPFSIYIEKGFKKIGWLVEIDGEYYGSVSPMPKILKTQMDDLIDVYMAIDDQARRSIDNICQKQALPLSEQIGESTQTENKTTNTEE